MKEVESLEQLHARFVLHFWATYGGGTLLPSQLRGLAIPEFDCPMDGQEASITVGNLLKAEAVSDQFTKYLRRCYKQDSNWWLFDIHPAPPFGRSNFVQIREMIEQKLAKILMEEKAA